MEKIKIGLIGCGKQAIKHTNGLKKISGVELVLADINYRLAEDLGRKEGIGWVEEIDQIFQDPEIKAIDICTPTSSHTELIFRAVETGKDFFCEKPLCKNLGEANIILDMVEKSGRNGMVGYIYRFSPVFELGKNFFEDVPQGGPSKVLGKVVAAFFRLGGRGSHQVWKHLKVNGGGAINEMLVHMLDLALWYFGPMEEATILTCDLLRPRRVIRGLEEEVDAEDYVLVRLRSKSGVEILCQADLITPAFTQFVEVQGESGTFMASIQPEMPSFLFCQQDAAGYPEGRTYLNLGKINLFEAQMSEFVRAVQLRKAPSRCTIRDSVLLMETINFMKKEKRL